MHKEHQRYILFEYKLISRTKNNPVNEKDFISEIWKSFGRLFGEYNAYKVGLWMVEFDSKQRFGILRCTNQTSEMLIAALTFMNRIRGNSAIIHTIHTSGTIKKANQIKKQHFSVT